MASRWTLLNHIAVFFLRAVTHNVHSSWLSKGAFGGCLCILMYSWRGSRVIPLLLRPLYRSAREPSLVRRTHESEAAGAEVEKWARGEFFLRQRCFDARTARHGTRYGLLLKAQGEEKQCAHPQLFARASIKPPLTHLGWVFFKCVCVCARKVLGGLYSRDNIKR